MGGVEVKRERKKGREKSKHLISLNLLVRHVHTLQAIMEIMTSPENLTKMTKKETESKSMAG